MAWIDEYAYKKKITIASGVVSGQTSLLNFPYLIYADADADLYARSENDDGFDIVFGDSSQITMLPHDLDYWDNPTGTYYGWVKLPKLSWSSNTVVWMYYGSGEGSGVNPSTTDTWDPDIYYGVWHMSGDANYSEDDRTTYNNDLNVSGTSTCNQVTGKIGYARQFSGQAYISTSAHYTLDPQDEWTVSCWAKKHTNGAYQAMISKYTWNLAGSDDGNYHLRFNDDNTPHIIIINTNEGDDSDEAAGAAITNQNWHYIAGTFSDTNNEVKIFVDGTITTVASTKTTSSSNSSLYVGARSIGEGSEQGATPFSGQLDEVRIYSSARTNSWLRTEYSSQHSPSTWTTFGPQIVTASVGTTQPLIENISGMIGSSSTLAGGVTATVGMMLQQSSGNTQIYYGTSDGGADITNWDASSSKVMRYSGGSHYPYAEIDLDGLVGSTGYHYRAYVSSTWYAGKDWADASTTFTTPPAADAVTCTDGHSMRIYFSCNAYPHNYIECWCKRWDEGNWDITVETFLTSSCRDTLFKYVVPGAVRELYNILGTPQYIDTTFESGNTLIFEPQYGFGVSSLREKRTIAVKNISDYFINPEYFNVKIEGFRL